ncbi:MAG: ExbD/TolR family protein [Pirellulales bacterium]
MKFKRTVYNVSAEPDMTPMIDMTFQLIAFFMVLLNFGEGEVDARIKLPSSQLAKPPEAGMLSPLVLQLTSDDKVLLGGDALPIPALDRPLRNEARYIELRGDKVADATVILRADASAKTGVVQEVIQKCQENGFEKFALRAKQENEEPR